MFISNCPKHAIEEAARKTGVRIVYIEPTSSTGLRHKVKLKPSFSKTLRVEAGERVFFKHTKDERERFHRIYNEVLGSYQLAQRSMEPSHLLTLALRARLQDAVPLSERGVADIPDTKALCSELGVSLSTLQSLEKLAHAIVGKGRTAYKKVAVYQRRGITHRERACGALCWHGFRDFFIKLFKLQPKAHIRTAYAIYKGKAGFYANYPETGSRNIGSTYNPLYASDACWC